MGCGHFLCLFFKYIDQIDMNNRSVIIHAGGKRVIWGIGHYPTLAREFQGFRVWGKFVYWTLELTDTPTNLANQVKVGHALDQSRSVQSRSVELRTHSA